MGYTVGQRLLASQMNNLTPTGDVTVGDDVVVTGDISATGMSQTTDTENAVGTTSSTSYTSTLTGGTACGVVFVAPASGSVFIFNTLQLGGTAGNQFCTVRVRAGDTIGAGADVLAAGDDDAMIIGSGAVLMRSTVPVPVTGLTPGDTYNVQQLFKTDNGASTVTASRKKLTVQPQI